MRKTTIRKQLVTGAILLILFLPSSRQANASSEYKSHRFGAIREYIEQVVASGEVPSMAVAVARDGRILWEEGFGFADREKNIPATEHTRYPLASISKPLTATGLMILVERGLIDLDQPINDYLGEAGIQARVGDPGRATVTRVAGHTAGLPIHSQHFCEEPYRPPPMDETIRRYGNLVTAPGERFQYSNLGYGLFGRVISRLSGSSYADFMHEEVFSPLGMNHTSVYVGLNRKEDPAVKYTPDGSAIPPCDSDSPAAGSIYGSVHDLIRFAMFHLKNARADQRAIITNAAIDTMQRPTPETGPMREWEREGSGYGIGWRISVTEDGLLVVHHSGGMQGASTILALVPDENIAVAALSNTHSPWPEAIAVQIGRTLLPGRLEDIPAPGNGPTDRPPFSPGPELVGSWEGHVHTYRGEISLELEIGESGSVYATLDEQPRDDLQSVSWQDDYPTFHNAGGGPFLRGWMWGDIGTEDVNRGRPYTLWIELKQRGNVLNGSMIALSQRKNPTGPLTHWVELKRKGIDDE